MTLETLSFETTLGQAELISDIVDRAIELEFKWHATDPSAPLDLQMDITAVHCNGCPLALRRLLNADDFNFSHDVFGIKQYINRNTGQLMDYFSPRFRDRRFKS